MVDCGISDPETDRKIHHIRMQAVPVAQPASYFCGNVSDTTQINPKTPPQVRLSWGGLLYRWLPIKNTARVPGPEWEPITLPT